MRTIATIKLKGEILPDEWAEIYRFWGFNAGFFAPCDVQAAVDALEEGEELVLEVNSIGGVVDAGSEIYSILEKCPNHTRAEVQSLAASAASYMIMACDEVVMSTPAQLMIHCGCWDVGGNKFDHLWAAQQLGTTDESILDTYCRRCGEEHREELRKMMEAETYLGSKQCVALGLADSIIGDEPEEDFTPLALVASVHTNTVRAMRILPDIRELMARREKEDAQMRLDMERYRF